MATLDSKIPSGPLAEKWSKYKTDIKLVNPANKRKYEVIVVGAGLAGSSSAATLAELSSIDIRFAGNAVEVHLEASSGIIDDRQIAHIRERVRQRYGRDGLLSVEKASDGRCDVTLRLPIEAPTAVEEDESVFVPALDVA